MTFTGCREMWYDDHWLRDLEVMRVIHGEQAALRRSARCFTDEG